MRRTVILIQSEESFYHGGGTFMLYRHEINYWFSDALMGLKVVFQLLLNVHLQLLYSSIYFKKDFGHLH